MRLIDADALEYTRVRIFHGLNEDGTPCVGGYNAVMMSCAIEDAPTVDAVPVVHGRWIDAHGIRKSKCENCGAEFCRVMEDCNYCPTCGAKMDREREDDFCSYGERREHERNE